MGEYGFNTDTGAEQVMHRRRIEAYLDSRIDLETGESVPWMSQTEVDIAVVA